MEISARAFLEDLLSAPGVSGYEQAVQEIVREYVKPFAEEVHTDLHGNVIATTNAGGSSLRRSLFVALMALLWRVDTFLSEQN